MGFRDTRCILESYIITQKFGLIAKYSRWEMVPLSLQKLIPLFSSYKCYYV
jgi:hypothetical protein